MLNTPVLRSGSARFQSRPGIDYPDRSFVIFLSYSSHATIWRCI